MKQLITPFTLVIMSFWLNSCQEPPIGDEPTGEEPVTDASDSDEPTTDFLGVTQERRCDELAKYAYDALNGLSVASAPSGGFLALERGHATGQTATLHVFDASSATLGDFVGLPFQSEVMVPDEQNDSVRLHDSIGSWFGVVRLSDGAIVSSFTNDKTKLLLTITVRSDVPYAVWQATDCRLDYCRTFVEHGRILISGLYREGILDDEFIGFGAVAGAGDGTLISARTINGPLIGYIDDLRFLKTQALPNDNNGDTRNVIVGLEVSEANMGWALWKRLNFYEPDYAIAPATLRRLDGLVDGLGPHEDFALPRASGLSLTGPLDDRRLTIHEFDETTGRLALRISADANACAKWLEAELTQVPPWEDGSGQPQLATNGWNVALATSSDGQGPTDTITIFDCRP